MVSQWHNWEVSIVVYAVMAGNSKPKYIWSGYVESTQTTPSLKPRVLDKSIHYWHVKRISLNECRNTIDLILSIKQMGSEGNLQRVAASGGYSAGSLEESWCVGKKDSWAAEGFDCQKPTKKEEKIVGKFHYFRGNTRRDLKMFILDRQFVAPLQSCYHSLTSCNLTSRDHFQPLLGVQIYHAPTFQHRTYRDNFHSESNPS